MIGRGRGKVILLGEHAVVYGHPALAGALALGVEARATLASATEVRVPAWGVETAGDPAHPVRRAVDALLAALGAGPHAIEARADVPARAGLGSSAALSVAVARAVAAGRGGPVDDRAVICAADASERVFHANPSGVDVALAARGGVGVFRRAEGLRRLEVDPFRLAVGLSGEPRDTAARVADVAARREADPAGTDRALRALGELADAGARALVRGAPGELSPLFRAAQAQLAALGLTSPGIERLCALAEALGAGAKLTGAGGGGAVIAAAPGREEAVVAAWRAAGFEAFVAEVGA